MTDTPPPLSPEIQEQLASVTKDLMEYFGVSSLTTEEGKLHWLPETHAELQTALEAAYRLGASEVQQLQKENAELREMNVQWQEFREMAARKLAEAHARLRELEQAQQSERERLHSIIEQCNALIDVEEHPQLSAEIDAVLLPCDEAGRCVSPAHAAPPQEADGS